MSAAGMTRVAALLLAISSSVGCAGEGPGLPTTLATAPGKPGALAIDRSHVYCSSARSLVDGGTLLRVEHDDESAAWEVVAEGQLDPAEMTVVGDELYWMNGGLTPGTGALMAASKAAFGAREIARDQWAARDLQFGVLASSQRLIAWTAPAAEAGEQVRLFDVDRQTLSAPVAAEQASPEGIAVGSDSMYWTDIAAGTVSRFVMGTGAVETLATGELRPSGIALDPPRVYWATLGDITTGVRGAIRWLDTSESPLVACDLVTEQGIGGRGRIAISDGWVYWFNVQGDSHALTAVAAAGGPIREVALAPGTEVVDLAVWDPRVHWLVAGELDGSVLAIDRLSARRPARRSARREELLHHLARRAPAGSQRRSSSTPASSRTRRSSARAAAPSPFAARAWARVMR